MNTERTIRRLAAILVSDVVGYSRMMAEDAVVTLAKLNKLRDDVFTPAIARHNGRIVELMGDGMLVEFSSVFDAVDCATAIQTELADQPLSLQSRIGVNLGDIIIQGKDIYGGGVNIAARLEPQAQQGGVCTFLMGNYETAALVFRDRLVLMPSTDIGRAWLAASLGHLGELDEARRVGRPHEDGSGVRYRDPSRPLRVHETRGSGIGDGRVGKGRRHRHAMGGTKRALTGNRRVTCMTCPSQRTGCHRHDGQFQATGSPEWQAPHFRCPAFLKMLRARGFTAACAGTTRASAVRPIGRTAARRMLFSLGP